ncbi:hypothetical protein NMG60_11022231, partial [Bertholletia excelsa]
MAADDIPCCETMFWIYLLISAALVAFAGLMSGLTLGLMSLSLVDLEVLAKAGQPQDRKNAEKILPIVKNQHMLLCTLLISNSLAMEALPIFLDSILPSWAAIMISVTLILAFGEIMPQAVCSRHGLSVGAKLSVVVRLLVILVFPISYPISKLLDLLLGKGHSALLRRAELKTLVAMHGNEAGKGGELTHDETTIISGALDLTQKTAKDAMTPMSDIFSLDLNAKLNEDTMSLILSKGHSRIPVYSGSPANIIGLVLVKNLIKLRPEDETPIRNLTIRNFPRFRDTLPLYDILNQFQKGHSHMAVVTKNKQEVEDLAGCTTLKRDTFKINMNSDSSMKKQDKEKGNLFWVFHFLHKQYYWSYMTRVPELKNVLKRRDDQKLQTNQDEKGNADTAMETLKSLPDQEEEVIGIITMEDVLEELLQEEILDETDEYVDVYNKIKINMLHSMKPSSRSPGASSHMTLQNSMASPLFSFNQPPVSSLAQSPFSGP